MSDSTPKTPDPAPPEGAVLFGELIGIMAALRGDRGCPWDRKQTFDTIKDYFLEEAFELVEAVRSRDYDAIREELGDVLFEVCFLSRLAEEEGRFGVAEALVSIREKLIRRHPHVFGTERVESAEEVPGRWARLKAQEKQGRGEAGRSILEGVPSTLPALVQALRVSERAVAVGFEWEKASHVLDKAQEELDELREALEKGEGRERLEEELGDLLFTLVNVARKMDFQAHDALARTLRKFRVRFAYVEARLREMGVPLEDAGIDRMERLWTEAKEKAPKPS